MNIVKAGNAAFAKSTRIVSYLTPEEVKALEDAVSGNRKAERDALLIQVLFQTGLRISELLSLTPQSMQHFEGSTVISVIGKGHKPRQVACPEDLSHRIKSYCYDHEIEVKDRIFSINRKRAWKILSEAGKAAGLNKDIWPHLLRHSNAVESLRQHGNPRALQDHLGHSTVSMSMRYLSTLTTEDSLRIQGKVKFD